MWALLDRRVFLVSISYYKSQISLKKPSLHESDRACPQTEWRDDLTKQARAQIGDLFAPHLEFDADKLTVRKPWFERRQENSKPSGMSAANRLGADVWI